RPAKAVEYHRSYGTARTNQLVPENRSVPPVDPLARLAVAESEHTDARADVGLNRRVPSKREKSNGRTERNDPQLERLLDFGSVAVHHILIDTRNGALLEPDAQAGFEIVAKVDQVVGAEHETVEVPHIEDERNEFEIVHQHIIWRSGILSAWGKTADRQIQRLLGRGGRWCRETDHQGRRKRCAGLRAHRK